MEPMQRDRLLLRRRFLQLSGFSSLSLLLSGCGIRLFEEVVGQAFEPLNQRLEELLLNPQQPVPEFSISAIEPEALIINSYRFTPKIDPVKFRLLVENKIIETLCFKKYISIPNTIESTSILYLTCINYHFCW